MTRQSAIALGCGFAFAVMAAHTCLGRTWTDRKGRQIEAEFISLTNGKVKIKRAKDGKTFVLPLDQLSDADQEYVRSRATRNEPSDDAEPPAADDPAKAELVVVLWAFIYPPASFHVSDGKDYEITIARAGEQAVLTYQRKTKTKFDRKVRLCIALPDKSVAQDFANEFGAKGKVLLDLNVPEGSRIYLALDNGDQKAVPVPAISNVLALPK